MKNYTKQLLENLENGKVHSSFIDNIWGADLAHMQLISKFNKRFWFSLCVIGVYSKYLRVVHLKDKKVIIITKAFQNILNESNRKPNKIWVDKGREFCNRSMKSWLQEMYLTHSEGNSVVAEDLLEP